MSIQKYQPVSSFGIYQTNPAYYSTSVVAFRSLAIDNQGVAYVGAENPLGSFSSGFSRVEQVVINSEGRAIAAAGSALISYSSVGQVRAGSTIISNNRVYSAGVTDARGVFVNARDIVSSGPADHQISWFSTVSGFVNFTGTQIVPPILISTASNRLTLANLIYDASGPEHRTVISELSINPDGEIDLIASKSILQLADNGRMLIRDMIYDGEFYYAVGERTVRGYNLAPTRVPLIVRLDRTLQQESTQIEFISNTHEGAIYKIFRYLDRVGYIIQLSPLSPFGESRTILVLAYKYQLFSGQVNYYTISKGANRTLFPAAAAITGTELTLLLADLVDQTVDNLVCINLGTIDNVYNPQIIAQSVISNSLYPKSNRDIDFSVNHHMSYDSSGNLLIAGQLSSGEPLYSRVGYTARLGSSWRNYTGESGYWSLTSGTEITITAGLPAGTNLVDQPPTNSYYGIDFISNFRRTSTSTEFSNVYVDTLTPMIASPSGVTEVTALPLNNKNSISLLDLAGQYGPTSNLVSYAQTLKHIDATNENYVYGYPRNIFFNEITNTLLLQTAKGQSGGNIDIITQMNRSGAVISTGRSNVSSLGRWCILKRPFSNQNQILCVYQTSNASFPFYTTARVELVHPSSPGSNLPLHLISYSGNALEVQSVHDNQTNSDVFHYKILGKFSNSDYTQFNFIAKGYFFNGFNAKGMEFRVLNFRLPIGPPFPNTSYHNDITYSTLNSGLDDVICTKAQTSAIWLKYNWTNNQITFKNQISIRQGLTGPDPVSQETVISQYLELYHTPTGTSGEFIVGGFVTTTGYKYGFVVKYSSGVRQWYKIFTSVDDNLSYTNIRIAGNTGGSSSFTTDRHIYISYGSGIVKMDQITGEIKAAKRLITSPDGVSTAGIIVDLTFDNLNGLNVFYQNTRDQRPGVMRLAFDFENYNDSFDTSTRSTFGSNPFFKEVTGIKLYFNSIPDIGVGNVSGFTEGSYVLNLYPPGNFPTVDFDNRTLLSPSKITSSTTAIYLSDFRAGGARVPSGTTGRFNNIGYSIPSYDRTDLFKYYESPDYYTITLTQNYNNLVLSTGNVYDLSTAGGLPWDGVQPVRIVIPTGIVVSSVNRDLAAISITSNFTNGILIENFGYVIGQGGRGGNRTAVGQAGGTAIFAQYPVSLDNYGVIAGGGGGGGAGSTHQYAPLSSEGADSAPGSGGASGLTIAYGGTMPTSPYGDWSGRPSRNLITDADYANPLSYDPGPTATDYYSDLDNYYWEADIGGTNNQLVWNGVVIDEETAVIETNEPRWILAIGGYFYYRNILPAGNQPGYITVGNRRIYPVRRTPIAATDPIYETYGQANFRSYTPVGPIFPPTYVASTGGQGGSWGVAGDAGSRYYDGQGNNFNYNYLGFAGGAGGFAVEIATLGNISWRNLGKVFGRYYDQISLRNNPRLIPSVREPSTGFYYNDSGTIFNSNPLYYWSQTGVSYWWPNTGQTWISFNISASGNPTSNTWTEGDYIYIRGTLTDAGNNRYSIARISLSKYNAP